MTGFPMMKEILIQLVKISVTNPFPMIRLPKSITYFLDSIANGHATLEPPVVTPPAFHGKIIYVRTTCNGCGLCLKFVLHMRLSKFSIPHSPHPIRG